MRVINITHYHNNIIDNIYCNDIVIHFIVMRRRRRRRRSITSTAFITSDDTDKFFLNVYCILLILVLVLIAAMDKIYDRKRTRRHRSPRNGYKKTAGLLGGRYITQCPVPNNLIIIVHVYEFSGVRHPAILRAHIITFIKYNMVQHRRHHIINIRNGGVVDGWRLHSLLNVAVLFSTRCKTRHEARRIKFVRLR